ncbi:hypothetical protein ISN45_Aa03g024500 [Arabidopsis thaliana x Arabidopsis arenosa]|uniref:Cysteine-rich transmembrane CYSTM domain-containing protein n=1 Tax=Arabidopsis thaliana x Arabidopsis arenosa TaxID=1240361 RepID=A0A8T2AZP4_9BRAS|nr:hypothetical protein ISN45_Aa03g024500 [Arabidopsis thaliana x Arabidopsis arenosa]
MNQSVQKPSETSSGPDTSPRPPIGYPTRDEMVGDPPAAAVKTKSKGAGGVIFNIINWIVCCCECLAE